MIGMEGASERFLDDTRAMVAEYGVAVIATEGFAYTVGLTAQEHPELLVCSLPPVTAQAILNAAARLVLGGRTLADGDLLDRILDGGYQLAVAGPIDEDADEAFPIKVARAIYDDRAARPLQVVYPDAERRFPWDQGYSMTAQPLLAPARPAGGASR